MIAKQTQTMRHTLSALTLLLLPLVAFGQAERAIGQLMVQLTTDDGLQIPAVLMYPATGINNASPAIVLQHGGPSGHAARSIGAYRFAAERLAARGYTTLSPVSRQSDDYYKSLFDEIIYDLAAAVDFVSALGHERIVLLGHSIGSLRITRYAAQTQDPRIQAHVHFAPTADMYPLYKDREGMAEMYAAAQAAVAAGQGGWNVYPDKADPDTSLRAPVMLATAPGRLQTAEALLDWWGPTANTSNSDWFKHIRVPLLLLGGVDDPVVPPGRLEALKALAVNSPRVDYRWYEGGDHYFTGFEDASSDYVAEWLADIGLGPGASAATRLVDAPLDARFTSDGERVRYPGVAYEPQTASATEPLFVMLYGMGDQILEAPLHDVGLGLAHLGHEGVAPQLRSSGFRGPLDRPIGQSTQDIVDWVNARRGGTADRPVVFVTYRESLVWVLETLRTRQLSGVAGIAAVSPPPDLPRYAQRALGEDRYQALVLKARSLADTPDNRTRFLVEKYFRPPPAIPGSTDVFMHYPAAFLEFYGPQANTYVSQSLKAVDLPVLLLVAEQEDKLTADDIERLSQAGSISVIQVPDTGPRFAGREHELALAIANWTATETRQ